MRERVVPSLEIQDSPVLEFGGGFVRVAQGLRGLSVTSWNGYGHVLEWLRSQVGMGTVTFWNGLTATVTIGSW